MMKVLIFKRTLELKSRKKIVKQENTTRLTFFCSPQLQQNCFLQFPVLAILKRLIISWNTIVLIIPPNILFINNCHEIYSHGLVDHTHTGTET